MSGLALLSGDFGLPLNLRRCLRGRLRHRLPGLRGRSWRRSRGWGGVLRGPARPAAEPAVGERTHRPRLLRLGRPQVERTAGRRPVAWRPLRRSGGLLIFRVGRPDRTGVDRAGVTPVRLVRTGHVGGGAGGGLVLLRTCLRLRLGLLLQGRLLWLVGVHVPVELLRVRALLHVGVLLGVRVVLGVRVLLRIWVLAARDLRLRLGACGGLRVVPRTVRARQQQLRAGGGGFGSRRIAEACVRCRVGVAAVHRKTRLSAVRLPACILRLPLTRDLAGVSHAYPSRIGSASSSPADSRLAS
ncbi:hypothetical protein AN219_15405 [Streptomyces nanshensis]|nr:hypothetical protein AN219_15405 [Streptomyces nanshensis]